MMDLLFFLFLSVLIWFWFDSLRAIEIARDAGKQACKRAQVQFLDDTVAGIALTLERDERGRMALRRIYRFEFSDTGDNRRKGSVTQVGHEVVGIYILPRLV